MAKYNGWNSYETWLVNIWAMDSYIEYAEYAISESTNPMPFKWFVSDMLALGESNTAEDRFAEDLILSAFDRVDWHELQESIDATLNEKESE